MGQADQLYDWQDGDLDIWLVRVNGIERKLTDREFARILVHFAKNRGFKSNRKGEAKEGDNGTVLAAVKENVELMEEKGYRTVAELLVCEPEKFNGRKRNKGGEYTHVIARSELEKEIRLIFEKSSANSATALPPSRTKKPICKFGRHNARLPVKMIF
ncbi:hypothetical protein QS257_06395 [Terrilactibacillus sp. S3-3]|nr:hypothetical protein QS257_06395 [Terrilactibacillus sp. S3-3]